MFCIFDFVLYTIAALEGKKNVWFLKRETFHVVMQSLKLEELQRVYIQILKR